MHNTKHILVTTISTEQYLWQQMRKVAGQLEDVFIQAVSAELD